MSIDHDAQADDDDDGSRNGVWSRNIRGICQRVGHGCCGRRTCWGRYRRVERYGREEESKIGLLTSNEGSNSDTHLSVDSTTQYAMDKTKTMTMRVSMAPPLPP